MQIRHKMTRLKLMRMLFFTIDKKDFSKLYPFSFIKLLNLFKVKKIGKIGFELFYCSSIRQNLYLQSRLKEIYFTLNSALKFGFSLV